MSTIDRILSKIIDAMRAFIEELISERQTKAFAYGFGAIAVFALVAAVVSGAWVQLWLTGVCLFVCFITWADKKRMENESK